MKLLTVIALAELLSEALFLMTIKPVENPESKYVSGYVLFKPSGEDVTVWRGK